MSYVKIWVHLVFSTKNRHPYLTKNIRYKLQNHIIENEQTIAKIAQLIKGESAFWINKNKSTEEKFLWQDDYFAVSVSESNLDRVNYYIKNQENHHRKKSFENEVEEFADKYKFELRKE